MQSKKHLWWILILYSTFYEILCTRRPGSGNHPPPPPPRPPAPAPSNSNKPIPTSHPIPSPPLKPPALLPNQCSLGSENADAIDGYVEANTLYILAEDPAECSGVIDSLFFCFFMSESMNSSIQLLSFRQQYSSDGDIQSYRKLGGSYADIEVNEASGGVMCQILKPNNALSLSEGDVLGFATKQGFNIALMKLNDTHSFQYMSFEDESELQYIPTTQLTQANDTATPVLKIVMNTTGPTTSHLFTTPTPNPNGDKSSSKRTISTFVFASVVIASAVIIVALTIVVFILCCCLRGWCTVCCGGGCKRFKDKKCLYSQGQSTQKVSGILDQSMQYNDLYSPKDPEQVITKGLKQSTKLHWNPAYKITSHSSSDRLDHIYESVEV